MTEIALGGRRACSSTRSSSTRDPTRAPRPRARRAAGARQPLHVVQRRSRRPRSRAPTSRVALDGEGAECALDGLFVGTGSAAPRHPHDDRPRPSALHQPRALQGNPRRIAPAASSTARSSCARTRRRPTPCRRTRTCCSRDDALVNSKPQLEIFADDVKCSARLDDRPARRRGRSSTCASRGIDEDGGAGAADLRVRRRRRRTHPHPARSRAEVERDLGAAFSRGSPAAVTA